MNKKSETIEYAVGHGTFICNFRFKSAGYSAQIHTANIVELKEFAIALVKAIDELDHGIILDHWDVR